MTTFTQEDFDKYVINCTKRAMLKNVIKRISKIRIRDQWKVLQEIETFLTSNKL
jgi:hypothetical protein